MNLKETIDHSYEFWFGMNSVYEKWTKENGLTSNSVMVLYLVKNSNQLITSKIIIDKLYLSKQTVNSVLNIMEKDELLVRKINENNKREKLIVLTSKGNELADKILRDLYAYESKAYSQLTEYERTMFVEINNKLLKALLNNKD